VIDLHCHLDLYPEPAAVARECETRGVYVLSVTNTPSAWDGTAALAEGSPRIRTALGLHPALARERRAELPLFDRLLPLTRYVGEVGLDGSPELRGSWDDQIAVFLHVLQACSAAGGRAMTIHSRRAASPVLDMLEKHADAGTAILHWFSGSPAELRRAINVGCWFSVGPAMLCSAKGRAMAAAIPRSRVLTESDGPFAQARGRPLYPWDVATAIEALASLWGVDARQAEDQLARNLRSLIIAEQGFSEEGV
jgi:TatD DNase family protein